MIPQRLSALPPANMLQHAVAPHNEGNNHTVISLRNFRLNIIMRSDRKNSAGVGVNIMGGSGGGAKRRSYLVQLMSLVSRVLD